MPELTIPIEQEPIDQVPNPQRLRLARKRRGITITELARRIGFDVKTVTAYENGKKPVTITALVRIQQVLDFPAEFFFGDDIEVPLLDGVSFRSLSRMTAKQRDMAHTQGTFAWMVASWLEKRFELPLSTLPDLRHQVDTPESAADTLRRIWTLGELPIRNMIHLLEANGVRVFSLSIDAKEVDAFSMWVGETPVVLLNGFKSAEHSRFDAAHELAHLVLHRHVGANRNREVEFQADAFASAMLMPQGSVRGNAPRFATVDELIRLKKIWGVSVSAINYRLHKLGLLSDWHYRALCIEIARKGFRTTEPEERPRESSAILPKLLASLHQDDGLTRSAIARELSIPVSELNHLLFGLTMTPIEGARSGSANPNMRAALRLVK